MTRHIGRDAVYGAVAGLFGAACMGAVALWGAFFAGADWYFPLELIGGLVTGSTARFDQGLQVGSAVVGAIAHLATGLAWGALFGALVGRLFDQITWKNGGSIGAFFGIAVWVVDVSVLIPLGGSPVVSAIPIWFGALLHVGYGAALGAFWSSLREAHARRSPSAAAPTLRRGRAPLGGSPLMTRPGDDRLSTKEADAPRSVAPY